VDATSRSAGGRSKSVDGLGAARAAMNEGQDVEMNTVDEQNRSAQKCASRIRGAMMSGKQNLLGIVKPSAFIEDGDNIKEDDAADKNDEQSDENKNDDGDEFKIPQSMKEIYRMSNKNRRKSKKTPVQFSNGNDDQKAEFMDAQKAEDLIARSGPGGKHYFDDISNKRQRTKSQDGPSTNKDESKKDDVELMVELGWVEDQKEAAEMIAEQKQSLETGDVSGGKETKNRNGESEGGTGKQHPRGRREKRGGKQSNVPYDYSKVGNIGVGGASTSDNPFFAGAAISGGTMNQPSSGKDRKKSNTSNRKGGKRNNTNYGGGSKTYVHRK